MDDLNGRELLEVGLDQGYVNLKKIMETRDGLKFKVEHADENDAVAGHDQFKKHPLFDEACRA